jgi:hypothetical protein
LSEVEVEKKSGARQANSPRARVAVSSLNKLAQLFISAHNETLSVIAMPISNSDCSPD